MKVVVFDLDDTLYKEVDYVYSGYRAVAAKVATDYGVDGPTAYRWMADAFGRGENPFDALEAGLGLTLPVAELVELYRTHKPDLHLGGEAEALLTALRAAGCRLGIITDGRSTGQRNKLEALGLFRYFDEADILISEETGKDKTSPDNFEYFCRTYPQAEAFFYVGDNPRKDFLHPNRLGWSTICLADDGRNIHPQNIEVADEAKPRYTVNALSDILNLIIK